ncbi:hypothetical protein BV341_00265 [Pseudomonas syringae pv. actinidiae]|nr:hypothetical protein BV341_00265 [Pseudomonas syringae pv. actinidiae]OSN40689.1 hypothetical protein BV342_00264 [Pseudomonas syringae pv. actinidiae]OSN71722.1 hypothetical protein BV350_02399 [Pseudomonas syringae pv. actinidiae]
MSVCLGQHLILCQRIQITFKGTAKLGQLEHSPLTFKRF